MGSYKDDIQQIADEIANEEYQKDFYDLSAEQQDKVYGQAIERYTDRLAMQIDKEGP